ncbi:hypothetical protein [Mycobacteroides chelonae]|uniref:hypothetical protein n=1 Tax=Mycobacteroides chelonae TaxID=1774 RepID=UPI0008A927E2|nr:hypothetical protein [Mycobacteroides chelonae]AYM43535.1 hypothetical protein DYE20_20100 [[Mycobacterium] chelonae subsp. gwanakae]OHU14887.1 hypothetical protein BKG75_06710 [Mycobacteroides chelonae]
MRFAIQDESAIIPLGEEPGRAPMQLGHLIRGIGDDSLFIILFKWPDNVSKFEYAEPEDNFLQSTGTADGLTVEWMKDGRLFTLGRPNGGTQPLQLARQDGTTVEVNQNEVLSPDTAADLFIEYHNTLSIDTAGWALREIPLAPDTASEGQPTSARASATEGGQTQSSPAATTKPDAARGSGESTLPEEGKFSTN